MSIKLTSINNLIEFGKCEALNTENPDDLKSIFGSGGLIKSNKGDPEVIITIHFKEKVNITGLLIDSFSDKSKPTDVQLFSNKVNIGFSDIGSIPSTETISSYLVGKQYPLKIAKYRGIDMMTIYISNQKDDCLDINSIVIYGSSSENTDMSQMKNTNP